MAMLIAYQSNNPIFFRKEDIRLISKLDDVKILEVDGLTTKLYSPAVRVTLVEYNFTYLLYDKESRKALREVLSQSMDINVARHHFPESFVGV